MYVIELPADVGSLDIMTLVATGTTVATDLFNGLSYVVESYICGKRLAALFSDFVLHRKLMMVL